VVFLKDMSCVAKNTTKNFYFRCFECNNENEFQNDMDIMVFSEFRFFEFPHLEDVQTVLLHIDLIYALFLIYLCCANGVVDDVLH
jgi:hypothetical protein